MFEVGKKYKTGFVVAECVWKGENRAVLIDPNESVFTAYHNALGRSWSEYKEPRKLEAWFAVLEYGKEVFVDTSVFISEADALAFYAKRDDKVLDVIKIEWTEKST